MNAMSKIEGKSFGGWSYSTENCAMVYIDDDVTYYAISDDYFIDDKYREIWDDILSNSTVMGVSGLYGFLDLVSCLQINKMHDGDGG